MIESTIEGFNHYQKTGEILESEFFTLFSDNYTLPKEETTIKNSIKILEELNIEWELTELIDIIEYFSKNVADCLIFQLKREISMEGIVDTEDGNIESNSYSEFILSFDSKFGILDSLNKIKAFTNIDLAQFVKSKDIDRFNVTSWLRVHYNNISFAEFYYLDYHSEIRQIYKDKTIEFYDFVVSTIDVLLENYASSGEFRKLFAE